jgi:hypothetical protein
MESVNVGFQSPMKMSTSKDSYNKGKITQKEVKREIEIQEKQKTPEIKVKVKTKSKKAK